MAYDDEDDPYADVAEPDVEPDDVVEAPEPAPSVAPATPPEDGWETYRDAPEEPAKFAQATAAGTATDAAPGPATRPAVKPDDVWETYADPPEPAAQAPSMSDTGDIWQDRTPPPPAVAAAPKDEWKTYVDPDETHLGAFGRELAHSVGPAGAGAITGALTAGAIGTATPLGPVGTILGGIGGGVVGGFAAEAGQEYGLKKLGIDDSATRQANREAYPWTTGTASALSNAVGFGAGLTRGAVTLGSRAVGALLGGSWETGVQAYHGAPLKEAVPAIVSSTAGGALFAKPRALTQQATELGERIRSRFGRTPPALTPAEPPIQGPEQGALPFQTEATPYWPKQGVQPQEAQIGGGEAQLGLPLDRPAPTPERPGLSIQPELPLEPPSSINAQGQLGFGMNVPHPDSPYAVPSSRNPMPSTGGVAKEAAPPAGGNQPANAERYAKERTATWPAVPDTPRVAREPEAQPHRAVGEGFAQEAMGVTPQASRGVNVLQPGQVDPTLTHVATSAEPPPPRPQTRVEPSRPAEAPEPPTRFGPQLEQEFPRVPAGTPTAPIRPEPFVPRAERGPQGQRMSPSTQGVTEAPVPAGRTRLYQPEGAAPREFTTERPPGRARYVDIPEAQAQQQFQPGRTPGSLVAHKIWEAPVYQRRLRPVQDVRTETAGGRPKPPPGEPQAPPPGRGGPPPAAAGVGVKVASSDLDARLRAQGAQTAQPSAQTAQPGAQTAQPRTMVLRTKSGARNVRVSNEPPIKGRDGKMYQKVSFKGRDYTVPADMLQPTKKTITEQKQIERATKLVAEETASQRVARQEQKEFPKEPTPEMSPVAREILVIANKIEATGTPGAKEYANAVRGGVHNNISKTDAATLEFQRGQLEKYQARASAGEVAKPQEDYALRNMLEPKQTETLAALIKDRSTPEKAKVSDLLRSAAANFDAAVKYINNAGWKVNDVHGGGKDIPVEVRNAKTLVSQIGGSVASLVNAHKPRAGKDVGLSVKRSIEQLRERLSDKNNIYRDTPEPPPSKTAPSEEVQTQHSRKMEDALDNIELAVESKDRRAVQTRAAEARRVWKAVPEEVRTLEPDYWNQFGDVITKMEKPGYVPGRQAAEAASAKAAQKEPGPVERSNAIDAEAKRRYGGNDPDDAGYVTHKETAFSNGANNLDWNFAMPINVTKAQVAEAFEAGRKFGGQEGPTIGEQVRARHDAARAAKETEATAAPTKTPKEMVAERKPDETISQVLKKPERNQYEIMRDTQAAGEPKTARPPDDFIGKLRDDIKSEDYASELARLRDKKPPKVEKLWNNLDKAPPERVAAAKEAIKAWNRQYEAVRRNQVRALQRDNETFSARQAETKPKADDLDIPDFLKRTKPKEQPLRSEVLERGRSGRPIRTEPLPIGSEGKILEAGLAKATGPKGEPRAPYMEAAQRGESKGKVVAISKSGQRAGFTGETVHAAAAFAKGAGYKPNQIFLADGSTPYTPPKATAAPTPAATPGAGHNKPPPGPLPTTTGGGGAGKPPVTPPPPGPPPGPPKPPRKGRTAEEETVLGRIANPASWTDNIPRTKAQANSAWRDFYERAKNAMDPIEQLTKLVGKAPRSPDSVTQFKRDIGWEPTPRVVDFDADPGVLARLTKGLGGRFQTQIGIRNQFTREWTGGTYDIKTGKRTGDPLEKILAPIKEDPEGFGAYIIARRALDLHAQNKQTGVDHAAALGVVAKNGAKWGPVSKELSAFKDRVLDNLTDVLGAKAVAAIKANNPNHVPFYRAIPKESELGRMVGAGLQTSKPIHEFEGSNLKIYHPLDTIPKNVLAFTDIAERNRVGMVLEDFNARLPPEKRFMTEVRDARPIEVSPDEINRHLKKEGIPEEVIDAMTIFRKDAFKPTTDRIRIFRDGKPKVYEVPENVGRAWNAMDQETAHAVVRLLSVPAAALRAGTTLNPEFMLRNFTRDQITAFLQSPHGYLPVWDFAKAAGQILKGGEKYHEWLINGGGNANLVSIDRRIIGIDHASLPAKVGEKVVMKPVHALQMMSELVENATRLGVYMRATGKGASPVEAAFQSREATLDFQRAGSHMRAANMLVAFLNARVEGIDRLARAFRDLPAATTAKLLASVTLPSIALWYYNKDDPRIKEKEQWEKDIFWMVPTTDWRTITPEVKEYADGLSSTWKRTLPDGTEQYNAGTIWRIPKPHAEGTIGGTIPERLLDAYFKNDPNAFKNLDQTIRKALNIEASTITPQVAVPFIEQFANQSIFFDRPLMPQQLAKQSPARQIKHDTSETAQAFGKVIRGVAGEKSSFGSPIVVDNYIRSWTGGLGTHVVKGIDALVQATDSKRPPAPEKSFADTPGIKAFTARWPTSSPESVNNFYTERASRRMSKADQDAMKKLDPDAYEKLSDDEAVSYTGEDVAKQLKASRDMVMQITKDPNMSPRDKRMAIDLTWLMMIEQAKEGLTAFEETKRKAAP